VRREDTDAVPIVAVAGEVDLTTAGKVRAQLVSVPEDEHLVVDLCETSFMDSSGLAILLAEHQRRGARLHVACVPAGPVARLFAAAGVAAPLQLHDSRDQAVIAAGSP
jgi:anti-anti-sigma factor